MLTRPRRIRTGVRLAVVTAGTLLALPLATVPAGAAPSSPGPAGPSVIGDGNIVADGPYVDAANPDPEVDATAGPTVEDGCVKLAGAATPADIAAYQRVYGGESPTGDGRWRYQLCAETSAAVHRLAGAHPGAAEAKATCAQAVNRCTVVVVWEPAKQPPQTQERAPKRKLGAFDHWLDFTPELATSPTDQDGLIARLPTWVWDRNTADVRGICLPIYGGVCGFAVRLGTTWKTEGRTFCRTPGRAYRPGVDDPRSASSCSWTYKRQGTYGLTGCKNWLVVVWRLPWYVPIVFPLELCNTDQVGVRESQVLAGGRARGIPVG